MLRVPPLDGRKDVTQRWYYNFLAYHACVASGWKLTMLAYNHLGILVLINLLSRRPRHLYRHRPKPMYIREGQDLGQLRISMLHRLWLFGAKYAACHSSVGVGRAATLCKYAHCLHLAKESQRSRNCGIFIWMLPGQEVPRLSKPLRFIILYLAI
jgi:hypothetical protein